MVLQILIDMQRQLYSAKNVLVFAKFWFDLKCFGLEPCPCFVRFTVSKRNWQNFDISPVESNGSGFISRGFDENVPMDQVRCK